MDANNNQKCLISTLMKLRESSKDAVVSADYIDDFALYMHVDRPVQEKFERQLKESALSDHAELILLCGNVGDGKSHILQMCKYKYPDYMEKFYVHNDSTASLYTNKSASFTLNEVLDDFSDLKIEYSKKKVILAINLGILSNFIDEDIEGKYSKLSNYIKEAGILEGNVDKGADNTYFHSINFADYHLYELTEAGPKSEYISQLLKKITCKSEDNIFYKEYCNQCCECDCKEICPIKYNYELLSDDKIQEGIIRVIIESIIRYKLIVSTRKLLNFIYEIIVDERTLNKGSLEPRKEPKKMNQVDYLDALLPNMLFNRYDASSSEVLRAIHMIDPLHVRNEQIDEFFVAYENSDESIEKFYQDLNEYSKILNKIKDANFKEYANYEIKTRLLHLHIRLCGLLSKRKDLLPEDFSFNEFMRGLYYWNRGEHQNLKNIYSDLEKGILRWNGFAEKMKCK